MNHGPDSQPAGTRLMVMPEHDGLRLDQFMAAATTLSRRAARRIIGEGVVARNRRPTRVQGRMLEWGDAIDVILPPSELGVSPRPQLGELEILFEDQWLLAVAKPAGVLSQPRAESGRELALDQLTLLRLAARDGARSYLRLVHRLDRLTSGAALFARNPQVHAPLVRAWSEGKVERRYLAVVEGVPARESTLIDRPIDRDRDHTWRFAVATTGREARTEIRVVASAGQGLTIVDCRLLTGRTHQVRVHLSDSGHPVFGDRLYGSRRADEVERPLLHAAVLAFPHPRDGTPVRITAPFPEDMVSFLPHELRL